jgi:bifunctional non-homologous end joining protein LigD
LVALDEHGRSRFQLLQNAERNRVRLLYCVFDLLYLDGKISEEALLERKQLLDRSPKAGSCFTAPTSPAKVSGFNRAKRAGERASWPSSPADDTTRASARANG